MLCNIYLPPDDKLQRYRVWAAVRRSIASVPPHTKILIGGDQNAALSADDRTGPLRSRDREFRDYCTSLNLVQLRTDNSHCTWVKKVKGHIVLKGRIDGWYTRKEDLGGTDGRLR